MNAANMSVVLESLAETILKLRNEVSILKWERDTLKEERDTLQKSNESLVHQLDFEMRKGVKENAKKF